MGYQLSLATKTSSRCTSDTFAARSTYRSPVTVSRRSEASATASSRTNGSTTTNRVSPPGDSLDADVPSVCDRRFRATIDSPRPEPPVSRVRGEIEANKSIEYPQSLSRRHTGSVVAHHDLSTTVYRTTLKANLLAGMRDCVVDQVAHHPQKRLRIAGPLARRSLMTSRVSLVMVRTRSDSA